MGATVLVVCAAMTRFEIGFWKNDITVWNRAIAVTKDNYVAHDNLGNTLLSTQPDAAFVQFQEAVRINPKCDDAQGCLAFCLLGKNRLDEAIVHLQKFLETNPGSGGAENLLGTAFYKKGQMEEAIIHFQKAVQLAPHNSDSECNLGEAFFATGRVDEAIYSFENALHINPDPSGVHIDLARLLATNPRSLKIDPACGWAEYYLGQDLINKGQVEDAAIHFQKAVQYAPDNADYQCGLGEVLLAQGQVNEAIKRFEKALHLNHASKATLNNFAWLLATSPDGNIRNGERAVQLAERACELTNYKQTVFIGTLAAAYAEAGQFDDAIATAQKACALASEHGETDLLKRNQELLILYQAHQPYHEPVKVSSP
jgi:tetratricopeptide (TPR) repeat protein